MLRVNNLTGFGRRRRGGGIGLGVNYIGTTLIGSGGSPSDTLALGTPSAGRVLALGIGGYKGSSLGVASVNVAGSSADQATNPSNSNRHSEIWYIEDSLNSSGIVEVNWSGSPNECWVDIWEITGASSATPAQTSASGSITPASQPAVVIGVGQRQGSMSLTNLTEDYNGLDGDHRHIAGSYLDESGASYSINDATTDGLAVWN